MRGMIAALIVCMMMTSLAQGDDPAPKLPPAEAGAKDALNKSPRHGEWVDVAVEGSKTPVKCWVVYPEVKDKAPVVIVIQEIFGLTDWIRSVTDELAAEGFIAIAPDLLSGKGPKGGGTDEFASRDDVTRAVRTLQAPEVMKDLDAVRDYGKKLPSANGKTLCVGFCWGGGMSFAYAAHQPDLSAAAVFYGTPPKAEEMAKIKGPVLGCYGGSDARVTATVEGATKAMKDAGKTYEPHVYEGAGHGFMRQQNDAGSPNMKAAQEAWPRVIAFFKEATK